MANTLLFLGSGASAPFGIPTMTGLVNSFEKQLREESEANSEANSKEMYRLYQKIKTSLKIIYDYVDLESIFSVIEDLSRNVKYSDLGFTSAYVLSKSTGLTKNGNITNKIDKQLANDLKLKLKNLTRSSCALHNDQDSHIKEVFKDLYHTIANGAGRHYVLEVNGRKIWYENWPIYTTNYDRVQEIYWEGISELNVLFNKDRDIERMNPDLIEESRLKLIKLHGSLDWYRLADGSIVKSYTARIRIGGQTVTGEMMLYPINQKDLYLHPWLEIFRGFKRDLLKTQNWVVIGYSFNDLFIREIFAECLGTNHNLIVVCPRASQIVRQKFGDFDNVSPVDGKLEDSKTISKVGELIRPE